MDWTRAIDAYCERTDASFWSEPVNAVTNVAFVIAAVIMWSRSDSHWEARTLSAILFAIGVGSFLFHTFATPWASAADVTPILLFSLFYIFLANRDFWQLPIWIAALGALAFIPYAMVLTPVFAAIPFFNVSSFYWPLPLLIGTYAVLLRKRHPTTARNLAIGAALLCLSLTARSVDEGLCHHAPLGTHFLWHILNAIMLGWMILVLHRHDPALAQPRSQS